MQANASAEVGTPDVPVEATAGATVSRRDRAINFVLDNAMVFVLITVFIVASITYNHFLEIGNLEVLLTQNATLGIIAVGVTVLMVCGAFDLSVVPVYVAGGCAFAGFADSVGWFGAICIAAGFGMLAGLINGFVVSRLRINSFIATLATASIFTGLVQTFVGSEYLQIESETARKIGTGELFGIPNPIIYLVVAFIIGQVLLAKTVWGRKVFAVGGNEEASRLNGLRPGLQRTGAYMLVGFCAGLAGVLYAAQIGNMTSVELTNQGGVLLDVIAIVVIGGTSLFGGEGAVWRSAIGLAIFAILGNVFAGVNASDTAESIVKGIVVLAAVGIDVQARKRRG